MLSAGVVDTEPLQPLESAMNSFKAIGWAIGSRTSPEAFRPLSGDV
jgi:hypothetical protein